MYCTQADLEAAWSVSDLLAAVDDDGDETLSPEELAIIARAIDRAANRMNAALEMRYRLASLAGSGWCRDCNAALALYLLATRRGAPPPDAIEEQYEAYLRDLEEIRGGRLKVPGVAESLPLGPSVTNFRVRLASGLESDLNSTGDP
jgi:phage gp36-like protein